MAARPVGDETFRISSNVLGGFYSEDIEDSSWVRVRDRDIFALHLTGRPSDEGAWYARKLQQRYADLARGDLKNSISSSVEGDSVTLPTPNMIDRLLMHTITNTLCHMFF